MGVSLWSTRSERTKSERSTLLAVSWPCNLELISLIEARPCFLLTILTTTTPHTRIPTPRPTSTYSMPSDSTNVDIPSLFCVCPSSSLLPSSDLGFVAVVVGSGGAAVVCQREPSPHTAAALVDGPDSVVAGDDVAAKASHARECTSN